MNFVLQIKKKFTQASSNITSTQRLLHPSCPHMIEPTSQLCCQFLKFLLNLAFHPKLQNFIDLSPCFLHPPFCSILHSVTKSSL